MKNRELLRYAVITIGLALALAPVSASTDPGDLVDPSFRPRAERDDATALTMPTFPSLRVILGRFHIRLATILPRLTVGRDPRSVTGRDLLSPRRIYGRIGIARRQTDPRDTNRDRSRR